MRKVADLRKKSSFAPAQWLGHDVDGREVYIRYRNWVLTVSIDGTREVTLTLEDGTHDDPSRLSTEKMMDALSPHVSFEDATIKP